MAVSFEKYGRLYFLDPAGGTYLVGDRVLVPTDSGPEVAVCVWAPTETDWDDKPLPRCAGPATTADLERDAANRKRRAEIYEVAVALIDRHQLPMKVVAVDYIDRSESFDRQCAIYFVAPHRVDFRALLGDLARTLESRIDLRQVALRDAAALIGGVGSCGRELCCAVMALPREPVSMRAARIQELPNSPLQISGACGRLMCCIAYENALYLDYLKRAPTVGSWVRTDSGDARVIGFSVPTDEVVVRNQDGVRRCPLTAVCPLRHTADPVP